MDIKLRKKAPFFCRYELAGELVCLTPLAETDGRLCPACAAKQAELAAKAAAPIPRELEPVPDDSQAQRDREWQERLAKGPIWPAGDVEPAPAQQAA